MDKVTTFLKSGRASVKIDGQRVSLSPDGIAKVRAERARRVRYAGGLADDAHANAASLKNADGSHLGR
jgi:hypothetical protein